MHVPVHPKPPPSSSAWTNHSKPHQTSPLDDVSEFDQAVPSARLSFPPAPHQTHPISSVLTNPLSSFKTQCKDYVLCKDSSTLLDFSHVLLYSHCALCISVLQYLLLWGWDHLDPLIHLYSRSTQRRINMRSMASLTSKQSGRFVITWPSLQVPVSLLLLWSFLPAGIPPSLFTHQNSTHPK